MFDIKASGTDGCSKEFLNDLLGFKMYLSKIITVSFFEKNVRNVT